MRNTSNRKEKSVSRIGTMRNEKLRRIERNGTKNVARNAGTLRNADERTHRSGKRSVCEQLRKLKCSIIMNIRTKLIASLISTQASTFHVILKRQLLNSNYQTLLNLNKTLTLSLNHVLRLNKIMNKNKR